MTEQEKIEHLSPQHKLLLELISTRPPACGVDTPTRIKDHLEEAKWLKRAIIGALIVAMTGVAVALIK